MTECWEAQSQLRAGKASGAYPGGGGGTWLSQAEGAGATHSPPPSPAPQFLPSATFVAGKKRVAWNPWLSIMTLVGLQQLGWECPSQELDALKLRLSKLGVNCLNSPCFTECETMISCQVREKSGPALPGGWSIGRSNHCRDLWATLNRRAWGREEGPGMAILVVCEGRGNWMSGTERISPGTQTQSCFQVPPWAFHESHHQEGLSPLHDTNSSEEGKNSGLPITSA